MVSNVVMLPGGQFWLVFVEHCWHRLEGIASWSPHHPHSPNNRVGKVMVIYRVRGRGVRMRGMGRIRLQGTVAWSLHHPHLPR